MAAANVAAAGDVAGICLLTFFYADEAVVTKRFVDRGLVTLGAMNAVTLRAE